MKEYILNAFDLVNVSFRTEAGNERVQKAFEYAQGLFEELKVHGGNLTRDRLLAILLLGITDDLLQQKNQSGLTTETLVHLLKEIDEAIPIIELSDEASTLTTTSHTQDIPDVSDPFSLLDVPDLFGLFEESLVNVHATSDKSNPLDDSNPQDTTQKDIQ